MGHNRAGDRVKAKKRRIRRAERRKAAAQPKITGAGAVKATVQAAKKVIS